MNRKLITLAACLVVLTAAPAQAGDEGAWTSVPVVHTDVHVDVPEVHTFVTSDVQPADVQTDPNPVEDVDQLLVVQLQAEVRQLQAKVQRQRQLIRKLRAAR